MALVDVASRKIGELKSSPVITRCAENPVLDKDDVPYGGTLIFNAGVCKYQGKYVMVFRNDYNFHPDTRQFDRHTMGLAFSDDGIHWEVQPKPCWEMKTEEIRQVYDPRLTVIDGRVVICFAMATWHGERGGVAVTDDFENFEIMHMAVPDNRNMVLFPEKIGGRYCRLERPFPVYSRCCGDRFDAWLSYSPDLRHWGDGELVLAVEDVPFANDKVGPRGAARQDRSRMAYHLPLGGPRPIPRQERLGAGVEEALLRRNHAAGPGEPRQGDRHEPRTADRSGSAL